MKKIGIITTSHAINYGAVLQAYALRQTLLQVGGVSVDIINYCGDEAVAGRKLYRPGHSPKAMIYNALVFLKPAYRKNRAKLIALFDRFKADKLGMQGKLLTSKAALQASARYDTLVCGSDQIWNLNLFDDDVYFLHFENPGLAKHYFAYAASIAETLTPEQENKMRQYTAHFDAISIREQDAATHMQNVLGREVLATVDPVYLLSTTDWDALCDDADDLVDGAYTLVFMISHEERDQGVVDRLCKGTREKIVVLNLHPFSYLKGDQYVYTAAPAQFVKLIRNTTRIITDSFHATSFSILYNKEFYNIRRSTRNTRIENLYRLFGMESRFVDGETQKLPEAVRYDEVNRNVEKAREHARAYLKQIVEVTTGDT